MTQTLKIVGSASDIAIEGAAYVIEAANHAVSRRGRFSLVLSGGSTPKALYHALAVRPGHIDWSKTDVYFGDERCVGPDDAESNYRMAREAFLSVVAILPDRIHRMRGELEPHEAADEYDRLLREKFPEGTAADLTLLGMGDDGHTASLFPGTAALSEMERACVANRVEKLNTWRLTMTAPFINRSRAVLVLVSGSGKAQRLREVLQGEQDPSRLPIQLIHPTTGQLTWLLDNAASAML
jgi:6-phosphogluconolactonase